MANGTDSSTDNTNRNLLILVIVLLILPLCCVATLCGTLALGGSVLGATSADFEIDQLGDLGPLAVTFDVQESFDERFEVDDRATLDVDLEVGSIEVVTGRDGEILVEAEITAYGGNEEEATEALEQIELVLDPTSDGLEITSSWPRDFEPWRDKEPKFDLVVTVPELTDLAIKLNVGEVKMTDVLPVEQIEVDTDVADVRFVGPLVPGAVYDMRSDVGRIELRLPEDSSFEIDAETDVGDVSVAFDVIGETSRDFTSKAVTGYVGDSPEALLRLRSDVGAILIRQQ